jgi:PPOX class probable F420-dependent enzyme
VPQSGTTRWEVKVDVQQALEFVRANGRAILGTRRQDGGVQMSPVVLGVDEDGTILISTRQATAKYRNVSRHPYAWACAINPQFYGRWAQVEGPVEIVRLPEAMDGLIRYYRLASGQEHPDWDDYRRAMNEEQRVLFRLRVERASGM